MTAKSPVVMIGIDAADVELVRRLAEDGTLPNLRRLMDGGRFGPLATNAALFAGGWAKVVLEQPVTAALPQANWLGTAIVPQAHLAGAVCGTVLGALFAATQARSSEQRD